MSLNPLTAESHGDGAEGRRVYLQNLVSLHFSSSFSLRFSAFFSAVLCVKKNLFENNLKLRFSKLPIMLILVSFFLVLGNQVFSQSYNFRNFNSEDGLPESYVYSLIQDDKGYLWIGTGNGLSKYNGFSFVNYSTNDSLADNFITCSIGLGENLWFGHGNGRITYFNGKKFQPVNIKQSYLSRITNFAEGPDGSIWASAYSDGLLKLDKDTGTVRYNFINENILIVTFSFLNDSDLLIGINTGLLYCKIKETGVLELVGPVPEIPESK